MRHTGQVMKTLWKTLLIVAVVLLALLLVAEIGLRWYLGSQMKTQFREATEAQGVTAEADPEVSFGAGPLTLGVLRGVIPQMDIDTPESLKITGTDAGSPEVSGTPAAKVHVTDLDLTDQDNPVAGHLKATTDVPDEFMLAAIQRAFEQAGSRSTSGTRVSDGQSLAEGIMRQLIKVTDVTSDPESQALELEFTDGAATLKMQPQVADGTVNFNVLGTTFFGFDLPEEVTEMIEQALQGSVDDAVDPISTGGLRVEEFRVVDGGAVVTVSGDDVPLSEASAPAELGAGQSAHANAAAVEPPRRTPVAA